MTPVNRHGVDCRLVGALGLALGACALTSKAEPVDVRYFSPERAESTSAGRKEPTAASLPFPLRLGRVQARPHLRERIVYRENDFELGYYDGLRWAERPDVYLRRAISRALFERRTNRQVLGADAPTVEVEISAFDEVRARSGHDAHVRLDAILFDRNDIVWQGTVDAREPVAGSSIEAVVAAMTSAVEVAAESLARSVESALVMARSPRDPAQDL